MELIQLDPRLIDPGWRARQDLGDLEGLAESISSDGQIHPIAVRKAGARYELIAGFRRLEACKRKKRFVLARVLDEQDEGKILWLQISENTQRKDFSLLELGEGLSRYEKIHQAAHPETVSGKTGRSRPKPKGAAERFAKVAAEKLGVGTTTVSDAIQLARDLPESKKKALRQIENPRERSKAERAERSRMRRESKLEKLAEEAAASPMTAGASRLDHGDNAELIARYKAEGLVFDLVLTDPPYGLKWSEVSHTERAPLNQSVAWDFLDVGWVKRLFPVLAPSAAFLIFTPAEAIGWYRMLFTEQGWDFRGHVVWWKTNPAPQHRPGYIQATEYLVWVTRGRPPFTPFENAGATEAHNVLQGPICSGGERLDHPTQKPIWILERLLERHAVDKTRVIDPFCGVGSTLVACKRKGLPCAGIELDGGYFKQARDRLAADRG